MASLTPREGFARRVVNKWLFLDLSTKEKGGPKGPALPDIPLASLDADDRAHPTALQRRIFQADRGDVAAVAGKVDVPRAGAGAHQVARSDVLMAAVAKAHIDVAHLDRAVEY